MGLSLPWHEPVLAKAVRTVYQRNAVIFQYNRLEAERPLTQNIIQSLADGLSCLSLGAPLRSIDLCVFITAGPITKLFAWGGRRVEDMCYERRRAEACVGPVRNPVL